MCIGIHNNPVGSVNHNCCISSMLNRWINQQLLNSGGKKLGESMHIMLTKKSLWHNCCSCFKGWFIAGLSICWSFIPLELYVATLWLAGYCIREKFWGRKVSDFMKSTKVLTRVGRNINLFIWSMVWKCESVHKFCFHINIFHISNITCKNTFCVRRRSQVK